MPGLFGFVEMKGNAAHPEESRALTEAMALAMKVETAQKSELYSMAGVGLGCVHIPLMNPDPQPVWNAAQTRCLIWYGEIFDTQPLRASLNERGIAAESLNLSQLLLSLYETFGASFLGRLNGFFALAIWDTPSGELIVANDYLGLQPLYYAQYNNRFAFASLVGALLADPNLPRKVDPIAITYMLNWELVMGDRTLLQGIRLLAPGTIVRVSESAVRFEQYWRLRFADEYRMRPTQEYFDEFARLLKQSIKRQAPGSLATGINLSGGLDSRITLGALTSIYPSSQVQSFTFGLPQSDDVVLAAELAELTGTKHHSHAFDPNFLITIAEKGVRLTDGMSNCVHFHAMTVLPEQSQLVDVIYTGYLGDTILSSEALMEWITPYNLKETRRHCLWMMGYVFPGLDLRHVLTDDFANGILDEYDADIDHVIDDYRSNLTMNAANHIEVLYLGRRNNRFGNDLVRNHILCRNVFCDKDLVEFCLQLPPGLRINRLLVRETIANHYHDLAKIPWDKTGLPLVECIRDLKERATMQLRWHAASVIGRNDLRNRKPRPMHEYGQWMRADLRPWVEQTLLSPRALDRGYIRPDVQRRLFVEHIAGKDNSRELGVLLSLELWHQMYLD